MDIFDLTYRHNIILQGAVLTAVAIAAPTFPYCGMSMLFSIIFAIATARTVITDTRSFPVIVVSVPEGPKNELIVCPVDNIIRVV
jgi:hypothetical protein